ncbi:hypothetical protein [Brevibacterium permense]|uniref:Uncharacterized protein n=1 Tax=Brevibacterium permense TaxID=234834 RepID=A0ABN2A8U2_9MICO|nr:hypothetical protein [Brevibacterium permense]
MEDTKRVKEVGVRYFRVSQSTPDGEFLPDEFDWERVHNFLSGHAHHQAKLEDHWFSRYPDLSSFAIHRPISTDFMTQLDSDGPVKDLADSTGDDGKPLSISTFVMPFGARPYFVLASGGQNPPGKAQLLALLEEAYPQERGIHWKISPVMGSGKLQQLKREGEITEFRSQFATQRDLLKLIEDQSQQGTLPGPIQLEQQLTEEVGDDVEVEIKVRLTKAGRQKQKSRRGLASLFLSSSRLFIQPGKKSEAKIYNSDGHIEDVSLVESNLAHKEEVSVAGDRLTFSGLVGEIHGRRTDLERILDVEVDGG